jgi:hypothetical protein
MTQCEEKVYGTRSQYERLVSHQCSREAKRTLVNGDTEKHLCNQHAEIFLRYAGPYSGWKEQEAAR